MKLNLQVVWTAILAAGLSGTAYAHEYGAPLHVNGRSASRTYFSPNTVPSRGVLFTIGPTDPVAAAFDTILFQGELPVDGVAFEASRETGGAWSAWQPVFVKRFSHGRFWAKVVFDAPAAGRIKIRAVNAGVRRSSQVQIYSMEAVVQSVSSMEETGGQQPPAPPEGEPSAAKPPVVSRADWGAKPPRSGWDAHKPYRFTQHHTQGRRTVSLEESKREVQVIQDFHQNGRGWKDIGYHFLVDSTGRIFQGRPDGVIGAHARGQNTGNIGISMMGNHHPPKNDALTAAQKETLKRLGKWVMERYGINASTYKGHRDYNPTDCPGDVVYGQLDSIRESFTADRAAPGAELKVQQYAPKDPKGPLVPLGG